METAKPRLLRDGSLDAGSWRITKYSFRLIAGAHIFAFAIFLPAARGGFFEAGWFIRELTAFVVVSW